LHSDASLVKTTASNWIRCLPVGFAVSALENKSKISYLAVGF